MSDKPYYHEPSDTIHLRVWALGQMVWGAFLGGLFVLVLAVILLGTWGLGLLLPDESKQAPDPILRGSLIQPFDMDRVV